LLATVALFAISRLLGLKVSMPPISIVSEPIFQIGSFAVSNALLSSWIVMLVLILASLAVNRRIPKDLTSAKTEALIPHGFQNFMEWVIEGIYGLVKDVAGTWAPRFFPIVMTIFLFVIVANWTEIIPGFSSIGWLEHPHEVNSAGYVANGSWLTGELAANAHDGYIVVPFFRPPSADLNFTMALALVAVVLSQYFGLRARRFDYLRHFFDFSGFKEGAVIGFVQFFAGLLEIIAELAKIISFSFRLFGNIFAGDILLAVVAFLIPYIASLPFYGLEVFVGFIQAVVFMMLTLIFFAVAVSGHGAEERG